MTNLLTRNTSTIDSQMVIIFDVIIIKLTNRLREYHYSQTKSTLVCINMFMKNKEKVCQCIFSFPMKNACYLHGPHTAYLN